MRGTEDARNPTKRLKRPLLFLLSYSPESNNIIIILSAPGKIWTSIFLIKASSQLDDRSDTTSYKYLFCGCRNYPLFKVQKESLATRYPALQRMILFLVYCSTIPYPFAEVFVRFVEVDVLETSCPKGNGFTVRIANLSVNTSIFWRTAYLNIFTFGGKNI